MRLLKALIAFIDIANKTALPGTPLYNALLTLQGTLAERAKRIRVTKKILRVGSDCLLVGTVLLQWFFQVV
jgi:hypothetical protein